MKKNATTRKVNETAVGATGHKTPDGAEQRTVAVGGDPETEQVTSDIKSAAETNGEITLDREQIFEVLSNERRRLVLEYLHERGEDGSVGFRELVDQVAAWENDTTVDQLESSDRKCVYTALRQSHLPKMDSLNVIKYDNQRGVVTSTEAVDDVLLYLKYVPEDHISWSQFYLLLSILSGALALIVWLGITPLGGSSGLAIAILIAVLFGVSSVVQAYRSPWIRGGSTGSTE